MKTGNTQPKTAALTKDPARDRRINNEAADLKAPGSTATKHFPINVKRMNVTIDT
jgi:hypothetical protein